MHPTELLAMRLGGCSSSKAEAFSFVAPTQTHRQQPTRARSTEESRITVAATNDTPVLTLHHFETHPFPVWASPR